MNHHLRRRSGFAMVTAIFLMGLCAMTLTALSVTLYAQARRTQIATQDAQLRQLLTAGAAFATAKAESNSTGRFDVPLPDSLRQESAQLSIDIEADASTNGRIAEVDASLPHRRGSQRLKLSLRGGVWQITEANSDN